MIKKIIILMIGVLLVLPHLQAQNSLGKSDDLARISLTPIIPDELQTVPVYAKKLLKNKLQQVATMNGLGGGANPRFIITADVDVLTKDITPTTPIMTAVTLQVNFYVADVVAQKVFSSAMIEVKGVGSNENKAYISGIKRIAPKNPQLRYLIESGKEKIIEYYNSQCDVIIQEAQTKASMKEFEKAMHTLTTIPEVCRECYDKAMNLVPDIYQEFMDDKCQKDLAKAQAAYGKKDIEETMKYLSEITPESKCYDDAQTLYGEAESFYCKEALGAAQGYWASQNADKAAEALSKVSSDCDNYAEAQKLSAEIRKKLKDDEQREWDNKVKEQDRKYTLAEKRIDSDTEVKKQQIEAAQNIAVESINSGNPYTSYYSNLMWIFR
ncbi:MAG: hypothetical protein PF489_03160 [Salinivirgaceae bacterium]|jgi:hypothetical protein|nr:hypothetical protein [Salinivirgaceae bacterium]